MLKYVDVKEVFSEVPDEISLAISISGCPIHCEGCHSEYLWENVGNSLNWSSLNALINIHQGITCICFMGGDNNPKEINNLAWHIKKSTKLKVAWYSGRAILPKEIEKRYFDYIKLGPYIEEFGPLTSKTTNQVMLKKTFPNIWEDITDKFQKE